MTAEAQGKCYWPQLTRERRKSQRVQGTFQVARDSLPAREWSSLTPASSRRWCREVSDLCLCSSKFILCSRPMYQLLFLCTPATQSHVHGITGCFQNHERHEMHVVCTCCMQSMSGPEDPILNKDLWVQRLCLLRMSQVTPMKSHQHSCPNTSWTKTAINMPK